MTLKTRTRRPKAAAKSAAAKPAPRSAVTQGGNQLGPVGGRIVAETFVRMLKRDEDSFMNVRGFTPSLPSSVPGTFTIADMLEFAGVLVQ